MRSIVSPLTGGPDGLCEGDGPAGGPVAGISWSRCVCWPLMTLLQTAYNYVSPQSKTDLQVRSGIERLTNTNTVIHPDPL